MPTLPAPIAAISACRRLESLTSESDLDCVRIQNPQAVEICRRAGVDCVERCVSGAGHFYPASALTVGSDAVPCSVKDAIETFLASRLERAG